MRRAGMELGAVLEQLIGSSDLTPQLVSLLTKITYEKKLLIQTKAHGCVFEKIPRVFYVAGMSMEMGCTVQVLLFRPSEYK